MYPRSQTTAFQALRVVSFLSLFLLLASCSDDDPVTAPQEQKVEITALEPSVASVGDTVAIIGKNFSSNLAGNTVTFPSDKRAIIVSSTSTQLLVIVPEEAQNGSVTVKSGEQSVRTPVEFQVKILMPEIESFEPESGKPGDLITVRGRNFPTDKNMLVVKVGESIADVAAINETELQFRIPEGSSTGTITISVDGNTVTSAKALTITASVLSFKNCIIDISGITIETREVAEFHEKSTDTLVSRTESSSQVPFSFSIDTRGYTESPGVPGSGNYTSKGFFGNVYEFRREAGNTMEGEIISFRIEVDPATGTILAFSTTMSSWQVFHGNHTATSAMEQTLQAGAMNQLGQDNYTYEVSGSNTCTLVRGIGYTTYRGVTGSPDPYNFVGTGTATGHSCTDEAKVRIQFVD